MLLHGVDTDGRTTSKHQLISHYIYKWNYDLLNMRSSDAQWVNPQVVKTEVTGAIGVIQKFFTPYKFIGSKDFSFNFWYTFSHNSWKISGIFSRISFKNFDLTSNKKTSSAKPYQIYLYARIRKNIVQVQKVELFQCYSF